MKQTRFTIDRADGVTECSHPLCDTLHRRFRPGGGIHDVYYAAWTIWDNEYDEHAYITVRDFHFDEEYLLKRDAKAALDRYLSTPEGQRATMEARPDEGQEGAPPREGPTLRQGSGADVQVPGAPGLAHPA